MAYTGLGITTKVHSATLSSHSIPAYPVYNSGTTYDAAFYTARQASNTALVARTDGSTTFTLTLDAS